VKAFKTELDPNNVQRTMLLKHAGAARWAYNWGLQRKIEAYKATGKSPSAIELHRELTKLKKVPQEAGGVPWMYEVSKAAPQEALRNLDRAFKQFFRRCKAGAKRKGFPRFKSRKRGIGSFSFYGTIRVFDNTIQLPRLGKIRLKEHGYLPTETKIISATVSERAGHWFVAVSVKGDPTREHGSGTIGIDVGIKNLAVLSDGTAYENPRALKNAEGRVRLLQKAISRKELPAR
jgi:putative transposase